MIRNCSGIQTLQHIKNHQRLGERGNSIHFYFNETFPDNQQVVIGLHTCSHFAM
jgi:hypothetical protein